MADETYRIEIPIVVEDHTGTPLAQANERISRFERDAHKRNLQIRKHFETIARAKIEPVMRIRDSLTVDVIKAKVLVRSLGAEHAAPVLAAKDNVSTVVQRVNLLLEALEKNDVNVIADLSGPLMDEINTARNALVALGNIDSAPVAELRGNLEAQLMRTMNIMRQLDHARAEPQATLRERVMARAREIVNKMRSLTARTWEVTVAAKDKTTDVLRNITGALLNPFALLGAGAGIGAGIFFPLRLAGEMEQARISMEYFTGSAEKGQKFLERLQSFAARTPFEFPDVREAAVGLMPLYKNMYGVDRAMNETMRTITAFGDAAGLTGAGMHGMTRALLGFRQIGTMGRLTMEELRQVTENLLIPMDIIQKELGITGEEMINLAQQGIDSRAAMEGIIRALEKNFVGGMDRMSRSLIGLTSTVRDTARLTITAFGSGMAEPVRRILLDMVGATDLTGDGMQKFTRRLEAAGQQVGNFFERTYDGIKNLWNMLAQDPEFRALDFGDKIIYVLNMALDRVNAWMRGEGGKRLQETFIKLGEIAGRAWLTGLEGMARGAVGAIGQGNILGGAGLLAVAGLLGGGMLLRGAWGLGKGAWGLGKGAWGLGKGALARHVAVQAATPAVQAVKAVAPKAKAVQAIAPVVQAAKAVLPRIQTARKARQIVQATKPAVQAAQAATPAVQAAKAVAPKAFLGKAGRLLGRAVFPLAIGLEAATVARAQDKARAAAQGIGALGGGWGGAKLGAVIGTAMLPGVGTIIGGALGGLGGYLAGRFAAGEAVDYTRRVPVPVAAAGAGQTLGVQVHAESKPTYHIQTAADAEGVLKIIKAHEKEIADQLADDVATKLTASFQNRTLRPVFTGGR